MINVVTSLDNYDINQIPTMPECENYIKALAVEIYENHNELLKENGVRWHSKNQAIGDTMLTFKDIYVEHGFHGICDERLHNVLTEHLTKIHVLFQQIAALYCYARKIKIYH